MSIRIRDLLYGQCVLFILLLATRRSSVHLPMERFACRGFEAQAQRGTEAGRSPVTGTSCELRAEIRLEWM